MKSRIDIPRVDQIVSRQVTQWESEQRARREWNSQDQPKVKAGPYITISRQHGCGGRALSVHLAARLGWERYDRNLLAEMARRAETDPQALEKIEQGPHNALHDNILLTFDRSYPGHHGYLKHLVALVTSLAARGKVIILGRGANFVLPPRWGLRVRLIAPLEHRVKNLIEESGEDEPEVRTWITTADRNQADMIRNILHRDVDEPLAYDLHLNMAEMDVTSAGTVIESALRAKMSQVEEAKGQEEG